ncbi:hypothetical protein [Bacillus thuringiensis]|uniref:hypothetical protein n=1 Tax=Bacillus thuringiensis TaxID=1428 RepID=UPI00345893F5
MGLAMKPAVNTEIRKVTLEEHGKIKKFDVQLPHIRNLENFLKGEWDLSVYDDCFKGRNALGDVDGSIELQGWTLNIEFKVSSFSLNKGQLVKAYRQAEHSDITTIFVFGETNKPTSYLIFSPDCLEGSGIIECDTESLKKVFKEWGDKAYKNSKLSSDDKAFFHACRYCK